MSEAQLLSWKDVELWEDGWNSGKERDRQRGRKAGWKVSWVLYMCGSGLVVLEGITCVGG